MKIPLSALSVQSLGVLLAFAVGACGGSVQIEHQPFFGVQSAIISPHDEPGGRFNGVRLSPGFGILYLNGFTSEAVNEPMCDGLLADEPEHLLEVSYAMRFKLALHSDDDLILAVRGLDDTWTCGDPPSATNANVAITQEFEPGTYEVWVGSRRASTSSTYRLVLSE